MINVDSLICRFGPQIATHCMIAKILSQRDSEMRPLAYEQTTFKCSATSKLTPPSMPMPQTPILSLAFIASVSILSLTVDNYEPKQTVSSSPILLASVNMLSYIIQSRVVREHGIKITTVTQAYFSEWLCINDIVGSLCHWMTTSFHASSRWDF